MFVKDFPNVKSWLSGSISEVKGACHHYNDIMIITLQCSITILLLNIFMIF